MIIFFSKNFENNIKFKGPNIKQIKEQLVKNSSIIKLGAKITIKKLPKKKNI